MVNEFVSRIARGGHGGRRVRAREDGDGRGVTLEDGVLSARNPQARSTASSHEYSRLEA